MRTCRHRGNPSERQESQNHDDPEVVGDPRHLSGRVEKSPVSEAGASCLTEREASVGTGAFRRGCEKLDLESGRS